MSMQQQQKKPQHDLGSAMLAKITYNIKIDHNHNFVVCRSCNLPFQLPQQRIRVQVNAVLKHLCNINVKMIGN